MDQSWHTTTITTNGDDKQPQAEGMTDKINNINEKGGG
jgi:hypothetical protein